MVVVDQLNSEKFTLLMGAYDVLRKPQDPVIDSSLHKDIFDEIAQTDAWVVHDNSWHGFVVLLRSEDGLLLSPYFFGSIPMIEVGFEDLVDPLMKKALMHFESISCNRLYTIIKEQPDRKKKEELLKCYGIKFDYEYVEMQLEVQPISKKWKRPDKVKLTHVSKYSKETLQKCFDEAFASSDVKYYFNMTPEERLNFFGQVYLPGVQEHPCSIGLEVKGQLIGFSLVMNYQGQPYITSMCVNEHYRGTGFGSYLLKTIIEEAFVQEFTTIGLGTEVQMKAHKLYSAYGFEEVSSKKYYILAKNG